MEKRRIDRKIESKEKRRREKLREAEEGCSKELKMIRQGESCFFPLSRKGPKKKKKKKNI